MPRWSTSRARPCPASRHWSPDGRRDPPPDHGRQLEDEPQPLRGHPPGAEARREPHRAAARRGRGGRAAAVHRPAQRADGDRRRQGADPVRRAGPLPAQGRRVHRGHLRGDAGQAGLHLCGDRALRAPRIPPRGRRAGQRQGEGRPGERPDADPVRGRGPVDPRGRRARRALLDTARRRPRRAQGRAGQEHRDRVRAGVGDRHRQDRDPGRRAGGVRRHPGAARREVRRGDGGRGAHPVRRLGEGGQHRRHHGAARRGRCPHRRREPGRRGVRVDRPVPRARAALS